MPRPPGAIVAAESRRGLGRVVPVGDAEWLWNGDADLLGLPRRNTSALLRAAVERLTGSAAQQEDLVEPTRALVTPQAWELGARVAEGASLALAFEGPRSPSRRRRASGAGASRRSATAGSRSMLPWAGPATATW